MDKPKNDSGRDSRSTSSRQRRQQQQQHDERQPVGRKIVSFLIPGENDPRLSTESCHGRSPSPTSIASSTSSRVSGILRPSKHGGGGNSGNGNGSQHSHRSFLSRLSSGADSSSMGDTPSSSSDCDSSVSASVEAAYPSRKQFLAHEQRHGPDDDDSNGTKSLNSSRRVTRATATKKNGHCYSHNDDRVVADGTDEDGEFNTARKAIKDATRAIYSFRTAQHISLTRVKCFILAILLISTVIACTGVAFVTLNFEHEEFIQNYDTLAKEVNNAFVL